MNIVEQRPRLLLLFRPECISPGGNRKISVMIWGYITYNGVGTLTKVDGKMNAAKYVETLDNCL
jgi:hypothetical protein